MRGGGRGTDGRRANERADERPTLIPLKETNRSLGRNRKEIFQSDQGTLRRSSVSHVSTLKDVISLLNAYPTRPSFDVDLRLFRFD